MLYIHASTGPGEPCGFAIEWSHMHEWAPWETSRCAWLAQKPDKNMALYLRNFELGMVRLCSSWRILLDEASITKSMLIKKKKSLAGQKLQFAAVHESDGRLSCHGGGCCRSGLNSEAALK